MIKIVRQRLSREEVESFLGKPYSDMIKFVVDVKNEIAALGGELHSDAEALLLQEGSSQPDLWGGNLYPHFLPESRIVYASMINIRPSQGNRSLEVKDEEIKRKMKKVLEKLLP